MTIKLTRTPDGYSYEAKGHEYELRRGHKEGFDGWWIWSGGDRITFATKRRNAVAELERIISEGEK